jgi:hypothetical protein
VSYAGRGTGHGRGSKEDVAPPPDDREVVQGRRKRRVALWVGFNGQDYVGSQINRYASLALPAPSYHTGFSHTWVRSVSRVSKRHNWRCMHTARQCWSLGGDWRQ